MNELSPEQVLWLGIALGFTFTGIYLYVRNRISAKLEEAKK